MHFFWSENVQKHNFFFAGTVKGRNFILHHSSRSQFTCLANILEAHSTRIYLVTSLNTRDSLECRRNKKQEEEEEEKEEEEKKKKKKKEEKQDEEKRQLIR